MTGSSVQCLVLDQKHRNQAEQAVSQIHTDAALDVIVCRSDQSSVIWSVGRLSFNIRSDIYLYGKHQILNAMCLDEVELLM